MKERNAKDTKFKITPKFHLRITFFADFNYPKHKGGNDWAT